MENIIIQRFRKVIEDNNLSVTACGKLIGIHPSTLNRQFSGENTMSLNTIDAFLRHFSNVSAEWLLRGEGDMLKGNNIRKTESALKKYDAEVEIDNEGYLKIRLNRHNENRNTSL